MAYMKNTTFDYFSGSNIDSFLDDCFEVDDTIAPVIKVLKMQVTLSLSTVKNSNYT